MSDEEIRWASTIGNITGHWTRAHRIYRAIQDEIAPILKETGIAPDPFPLNHIAYCNHFLRPAPTAGGSMQGNERQQDLDAAEEVLRWFILSHPRAVDRHLTLRRPIRRKRVPRVRHPLHEYYPPGHPLVEYCFPKLLQHQRARPVLQLPRIPALDRRAPLVSLSPMPTENLLRHHRDVERSYIVVKLFIHYWISSRRKRYRSHEPLPQSQ